MRWLLTVLFALSACASEEQMECESCDVDEFINEWWEVSTLREDDCLVGGRCDWPQG